MVLNTDVKTKAKYWSIFEELIRKQFEFGGVKYAMSEDKEITDWACEICPGDTGADWILGTIAKYLGRLKTQKREKDILKIATFAFIFWLKMGYHLKVHHDEDTDGR